MSLSSEAIFSIVSVTDYRSFIKKYKEERAKTLPFSYALIAKRGGFKSRSFPRDVAVGNKNLTITSLYPMIRGMGLKGELADFFKILVNIEHPETCLKEKSIPELKAQLENLRSRIKKKRKLISNKDPYEVQFFPIVYAACGTKENGASIESIKSKTKLPEHVLIPVLDALEQQQIVIRKGSIYFVKEPHIFIESMGASNGFKKFFLYILMEASTRARDKFNTDDALYFASSFSISKEKIPQLKRELRELLLKFVDESEHSNGNKVANLACALF